MNSFYAKTGMFVMPSSCDGFLNALAEDSCVGCSSVSFDFVKSPIVLIQTGVSGILIEANNINIMAKVLDDLIVNKKQRRIYQTKGFKVSENQCELKIANRVLNFIKN